MEWGKGGGGVVWFTRETGSRNKSKFMAAHATAKAAAPIAAPESTQ